MTGGVSKSVRYVSNDPADLLIEALVAENGNAAAFHAVAFRAGEVSRVQHVNDQASALVLKDGVVIPVALPFQELKEKIYSPNFSAGSAIDLMQVTGAAAAQIVAPELAKKAAAQGSQRWGMKFHALLRKGGSAEQAIFDFFESDIMSMERADTDRSRCGTTVILKFNAAATKGPFGTGQASLDMPQDEFLKVMVDHKNKAGIIGTVDLVELFSANPKKYGVGKI